MKNFKEISKVIKIGQTIEYNIMDWFKFYINRNTKEFVFKAGYFNGILEGFSLSDNFLKLKDLANVRAKWIKIGYTEKGVNKTVELNLKELN